MEQLRVMLTPATYQLIAALIRRYPNDSVSYDQLVSEYEQVIIGSILRYMDDFRHAQAWFSTEKVHEIIGFTIGVNDDGSPAHEQPLRLVFSPFMGVYVFTPEEIEIDDLYYVRKVIAEASAIDPDNPDNSSQSPAMLP